MPPHRDSIHWWIGGAVVALCAIVLFAPVATTTIYVDPVTGSMLVEQRLCGQVIRRAAKPTDLELWLRRRGSHIPVWQHLSTVHGTLQFPTCRECSSAPEICELNGRLSAAYVKMAADDEIEELTCVLRTGSPAARKAAVQKALDRIFESESDRASVQ
jgi:hypothetical protein